MTLNSEYWVLVKVSGTTVEVLISTGVWEKNRKKYAGGILLLGTREYVMKRVEINCSRTS